MWWVAHMSAEQMVLFCTILAVIAVSVGIPLFNKLVSLLSLMQFDHQQSPDWLT